MSSLLKNIIIALCIVVVAGIIFMVVKGKGEETAETSTFELDPLSDISLKTEKILSDTQKINDYKMDVSIFQDARFTSLKNFRVDIKDVDTGRTNPFLPLE